MAKRLKRKTSVNNIAFSLSDYCVSSDEESDHLEFEEQYDSDIDADYVPGPEDDDSDSYEIDPDQLLAQSIELKTTKRGRVGRQWQWRPPVNITTTSATTMASSATPDATADRKLRRALDHDLVVTYNTDTIESAVGIVWSCKPVIQAGTRTSANNIISPIRCGPSQEALLATTPEKCFSLLFTDEIIDEVVQWTNEKIKNEAPKFRTMSATLERTSAAEIRALLGILIYSGYRRDNHLSCKDLWNQRMASPMYRAAMSEGRFIFLLWCLRFNNQNTRAQSNTTDKFAPVRNVWDIFIENCNKHFVPYENLTVDEQLLSFRGKCPFRMYIPNKPAKYGIKIIMINDVKSKYMLSAMPYLGKDENQLYGRQSLGYYYTKEITRKYHHSNRNVTTDNWFTSMPLILDLKINCGLTLVGKVNGNKKEIPAIMKDKKSRSPGSTSFLFTKYATLVSHLPNKANAKRMELLMSSMHSQGIIDERGKPEIIDFYNHTKGAVDTFDQMCSQVSCGRKTSRWPLCLFYGMVNAGVINSWIIFNENMKKYYVTCWQRKTYMGDLSYQLIKPWAAERLNAPSLSRTLREAICLVCKMPEVCSIATKTAAADMKHPMVRCVVCPSAKDKKTRFRCYYCSRPVCPKHYYPACDKCTKYVKPTPLKKRIKRKATRNPNRPSSFDIGAQESPNKFKFDIECDIKSETEYTEDLWDDNVLRYPTEVEESAHGGTSSGQQIYLNEVQPKLEPEEEMDSL